jgi:hypothetical protein
MMIVDVAIALALVLLCSAWFGSFFDRRARLGLVPFWRRVVAWVALLMLTASLIELLYCLEIVGRSGHSLSVILSLFETGLVLAVAAFLACWFSSRTTLACLLPSTILVGISWFLVLSLIG